MYKCAICVFAVGGIAASASAGPVLLHQESFEGRPGTGYSMLPSAFDDGGFDFFDQYTVPDLTNPARDDFMVGFDGTGAIMGQDIDDGGARPPTGTVLLDPVTITGSSNLAVRASLAALDSEPDFTNYEAADGDGIEVFADIDGGGAVLIGAFKPNSTGDSDLYQDTDLDGVGDGTRLVAASLADFDFLISGTGDSLVVSIDFTSTGSFEPLVLDNVRVLANIPAPSSLALLGLAGLVGTRRRR